MSDGQNDAQKTALEIELVAKLIMSARELREKYQ